MDLQLQDAGAVVVGAAQGIGLAIATEFSREQCRVALWDIDPLVTTAAENLKKQSNADVMSAVLDATNLEQVKAAAEKTLWPDV